MTSLPRRAGLAGLFALYQLTIVLGIALFPLALVARRVGLSIPMGRLVDRMGRAYESAAASIEG